MEAKHGFKFIVFGSTAKAGKPVKAVQQKLAATMNNCIACHTSFQLPVLPSHP